MRGPLGVAHVYHQRLVLTLCNNQTSSYRRQLGQFTVGGDTPIYFGSGSIVVEDPEKMLPILLQAVDMAGVRAIISRGWSNFQYPGNSNIYFLGDCPHEWLFQHVAAVVRASWRRWYNRLWLAIWETNSDCPILRRVSLANESGYCKLLMFDDL